MIRYLVTMDFWSQGTKFREAMNQLQIYLVKIDPLSNIRDFYTQKMLQMKNSQFRYYYEENMIQLGKFPLQISKHEFFIFPIYKYLFFYNGLYVREFFPVIMGIFPIYNFRQNKEKLSTHYKRISSYNEFHNTTDFFIKSSVNGKNPLQPRNNLFQLEKISLHTRKKITNTTDLQKICCKSDNKEIHTPSLFTKDFFPFLINFSNQQRISEKSLIKDRLVP
eukprot:TRINITY_DN6202_c0_g1_i6.p2 TRINITY_DN6202_c0_g1~~TRINITY_DN6202_c0_g1_i6.p2  ORF type:complete len:221 (-),score=0.20 TRINITY_DN6202_c0_g1_i6:174-836(-)